MTETIWVDLKTLWDLVFTQPILLCHCEEKSWQVFGLYYIMDRPHTFDAPTIQYYHTVSGPELRDFEWSGHSWTAMEVIVMHTTFIDLKFKSDYLL